MTKRLILREFAKTDIPDIKIILNEAPEAVNFMGVEDACHMPVEELLMAYIDNQYRFYGYGMWGIFEKDNQKLIGMAGLCNTDNGVELGYVIKKSKQRQGFATEACRYILNEICEYMGIDSVICTIESGNYASIELAEKLQRHNELKIIKIP